jgi:hypothetical protein
MKTLLKYLATWKEEFVGILIAFAIFFGFRYSIVYLDPQAALYDLGKFEDLTYAILRFIVLSFTAWIMLRIMLPTAYDYLKDDFYENFKNYSEWEKRKISLVAYLAAFFALVLLAM